MSVDLKISPGDSDEQRTLQPSMLLGSPAGSVLWDGLCALKKNTISAPSHGKHNPGLPGGPLAQGHKQNSDGLALVALTALMLALLLCKLYPLI